MVRSPLRLVSVAVLAATTAAASLAACGPSTPKFAFKHAEQRGRLEKNGLRFVIMPDPSTQMIEVDVRYDVGSREDPPGKAGIAHLVEHMMFQQRPDGPDSPPLWTFLGQLTTYVNAFTNWDSTHYQAAGRVEQLDALLKIDAMRLFYRCQTIPEEQFLREREVVRNEIRQRTGTADGQIPQLVLSSVYPENHAYARMIGGDDQQLSNITLKDVCEFMDKYYTPDWATLIIAGGVSVEEASKSIQKWFGNLERRTPAARAKVAEVRVNKDRKTYDLDIERPIVSVAWALPAANTKEGEAAQFGIGQAFARVASAAARYDFAYGVYPQVLGGQEAPVFAILIELKSLSKLDDALDFVWKAARQAHRGFDQGTWSQIEESKNRGKADLIRSLESLYSRTLTVAEKVQFDKEFDFDSNELYVFNELDKIGKFDGAAIGGAIKRALDPSKARIAVFKPNKEGIKGDKRSNLKFATKSHDSREIPEVDPREAKRPLKVAAELKGMASAQRFTLGNGMQVALLPYNGMPIVSAQLMFRVGDAHVPTSPALASAAADFLSLPMDAEAMYRTGINVGCQSSADRTTCYTGGINIYLDVMVKALDRFIKAGEYQQEQIERFQKRFREDSKLQSTQQQLEFERQRLVALYGPEHPYTLTGVLTPAAVDQLGRDSLNTFRAKHYSAANATLVIAGNFDAKAAESLVRDTFGSWSKGHQDTAIAPTQYQRTGPAYVGVVGKEAPQMAVTISYPAPGGIDGQEAARQVLAEMLNRKMAAVREKLGATYGTYAGRGPRVGPTAYSMGGTVDASRAGEAMAAMRAGVEELRQGVDFDVEFVRGRRKLVQDLLGESTVSYEVAGRLGFIAAFGLDTNFYNTLLQQIAAVSPAQVKALLASELPPANEVIVTMADRATLTKAFADAGLTDVKIVEPEYK